MNHRKQYWNIYEKYCKLNNSLQSKIKNIINKIDDDERKNRLLKSLDILFSRYDLVTEIKKPSKGELEVMNFLDKIAIKFELFYFYLHRWLFCSTVLFMEALLP